MVCFLNSPHLKWPVGGYIYEPHRESSHWGTKPSFMLLTGRCFRLDWTRPVVLTIGARALIGLWAESGLTRSDASGHAGAALEPLWTRSDAVLCASGRLVPLRPVTLKTLP